MTTMEQEVVEKYYQLDRNAKARVRAQIEQTTTEALQEPFDWEAWFKEVDAIREQMRVENGGTFPQIDVVQMLREIRNGDDE